MVQKQNSHYIHTVAHDSQTDCVFDVRLRCDKSLLLLCERFSRVCFDINV